METVLLVVKEIHPETRPKNQWLRRLSSPTTLTHPKLPDSSMRLELKCRVFLKDVIEVVPLSSPSKSSSSNTSDSMLRKIAAS